LEGGLAVAYDASIALAHRGGTGPGAEAVLQPLRNERGTLWLVADGEPANATELRLELVAAGHQFKSGCGSEVILHLYEQDGIGALGASPGALRSRSGIKSSTSSSSAVTDSAPNRST
jgi:asparagine synthetase B (glutamine-hydrolysing)